MNVIVIGGGLTGSLFALSLAKMTKSLCNIVLIESHLPQQHQQTGFDQRNIVLAEGSRQQLLKTGLWSAFEPHATPLTSIHVSDRGNIGHTILSAKKYQLAAFGWVVNLQAVGQHLVKLIEETPVIKRYCPAKAINIERTLTQATVILDNGLTITGHLIVAADGSNSSVAHLCHTDHYYRYDYQQIATIANIITHQPHHYRAYERFTVHGPIALLPVNQCDYALVWCQSYDNFSQINQLDDKEFLTKLQHAFGWRAGLFQHVSQRTTYPLALSVAQQTISHRLVLIGNAAQTLHPIAGQGFNLALRDISTLASEIAHAYQNNQDIGEYTLLHHYHIKRQHDKQRSIMFTDQLLKLFSTQRYSFSIIRNLGLLTLNSFPFYQDPLICYLLGWHK